LKNPDAENQGEPDLKKIREKSRCLLRAKRYFQIGQK